MESVQVINKCSIKDCNGKLDENETILLMTSCMACGGGSHSFACPCNVCRRLHWKDDGSPVCNRAGQKAFLKNGQVVFQ